MTSLETCIKEAVEKGGYEYAHYHSKEAQDEILLDPLFWQALGRARGWGLHPNGKLEDYYWMSLSGDATDDDDRQVWWQRAHVRNERITPFARPIWLHHLIRFIHHLSAGKDAESFFAAL